MGDFSSISRVGEGTGDFSGSELGLGCSDRTRTPLLSPAGAATTMASTPEARTIRSASQKVAGTQSLLAAHLSLVTVPDGGGGDHHPERYCPCLGVASHCDSGSVDSADYLSILCLHPLSPLSFSAAVSQHHSNHDKGIHHSPYKFSTNFLTSIVHIWYQDHSVPVCLVLVHTLGPPHSLG